jgi:hypothetical protein
MGCPSDGRPIDLAVDPGDATLRRRIARWKSGLRRYESAVIGRIK